MLRKTNPRFPKSLSGRLVLRHYGYQQQAPSRRLGVLRKTNPRFSKSLSGRLVLRHYGYQYQAPSRRLGV